MPEAAPIRSRLRATCPFSRAFWRRRGVACSVWLACGISQWSEAGKSVSEFQNPFRGFQGSSEAGVEKARPKPHGSAQQRQAKQVLDRDPDKQNGQLRRSFSDKTERDIREQSGDQHGRGDLQTGNKHAGGEFEEGGGGWPGEREMAGWQIVEAARQSAQQPVWDAELNEEQEHNQFVESGEHGGVGLAVGIDDAGERISHLHAAHLAGNLSGFENELDGESEEKSNGEFAEQKRNESGSGKGSRGRGNERHQE